MRFAKLIGAMCLCAIGFSAQAEPADLKQQVADTERAFAATMKNRDHAAFVSFLSDEAVFFSGPVPLHGKDSIGKFWAKFYDKAEAPFAWEVDETEVLASGTLAITGGPVYDGKGKPIARFSSIWRLEAPGKWRIIFDRGWDLCDCKK